MPGLPVISNPDDELALQLESERSDAREAVSKSKSKNKNNWHRRPAEETFKLGRYSITGRIASGGMATVYRARLVSDGGFAREFAIKVIHSHLAAAEGFKDRFFDEARLASRVSHPNVVATIDFDQDRGYHFLVLELVDGVTLRQLQVNDLHRSTTTQGTHLTPVEAARVVCDAARGLHAVHTVVDEHGESLDVVHRDLSPHNLMLDVTGRTVLIDLGLAKSRDQLGHTQTGVLCGKLPYMSPEQSRVAPLDARSDVFSLGSVLFELAVGKPPFGDDHTPGTLDKLRKCDPDRLARMMVDADVPSWLAQVVLGCLRRLPEDRYPTAAALADALDEGMRRAGIDQAIARQALAQRAEAVRDQLGPVYPADPLPPLIAADPTGSHRIVSAVARMPSWVGGLGMALAGALAVVLGTSLLDTFDTGLNGGAAQSSEPDWLPSLAADLNLATPRQDPAPTKPEDREQTEPASKPRPNPTDALSNEDEVVLQPARSRKRKAATPKADDPPDEFKSNPYD